MAHNLTRAAGHASTFHTTARPPTVRDQLINIPARIATVVRDESCVVVGHIGLNR